MEATPAEPAGTVGLFDQDRTQPDATVFQPSAVPATPASELLPWARRLSFTDDTPGAGGSPAPDSSAPGVAPTRSEYTDPAGAGPPAAEPSAAPAAEPPAPIADSELPPEPTGPPRPPNFPKVHVGQPTRIVNIGSFPPAPDLQYLNKMIAADQERLLAKDLRWATRVLSKEIPEKVMLLQVVVAGTAQQVSAHQTLCRDAFDQLFAFLGHVRDEADTRADITLPEIRRSVRDLTESLTALHTDVTAHLSQLRSAPKGAIPLLKPGAGSKISGSARKHTGSGGRDASPPPPPVFSPKKAEYFWRSPGVHKESRLGIPREGQMMEVVAGIPEPRLKQAHAPTRKLQYKCELADQLKWRQQQYVGMITEGRKRISKLADAVLVARATVDFFNQRVQTSEERQYSAALGIWDFCNTLDAANARSAASAKRLARDRKTLVAAVRTLQRRHETLMREALRGEDVEAGEDLWTHLEKAASGLDKDCCECAVLLQRAKRQLATDRTAVELLREQTGARNLPPASNVQLDSLSTADLQARSQNQTLAEEADHLQAWLRDILGAATWLQQQRRYLGALHEQLGVCREKPDEPLTPRALEARLDEVAVLVEMEYLRLPFVAPKKEVAAMPDDAAAAEAAAAPPAEDESAAWLFLYLTVSETDPSAVPDVLEGQSADTGEASVSAPPGPVSVLLTKMNPEAMAELRAAEQEAARAAAEAAAAVPEESEAEPFENLGISWRSLQEFVERHREWLLCYREPVAPGEMGTSLVAQITAGPRDGTAQRSVATAHVLRDRLLSRVTAASGCSYARLLAQRGSGNSVLAGAATRFVSHCWGTETLVLFNALAGAIHPAPAPSARAADRDGGGGGDGGGRYGGGRDGGGWGASTRLNPAAHAPACISAYDFFWIDLFCVNLWSADSLRGVRWVRDELVHGIEAIGHTVAVLEPWDRPTALRRGWCLWEWVATLDCGAPLDFLLLPEHEEKVREDLFRGGRAMRSLIASLMSADLYGAQWTHHADALAVRAAADARFGHASDAPGGDEVRNHAHEAHFHIQKALAARARGFLSEAAARALAHAEASRDPRVHRLRLTLFDLFLENDLHGDASEMLRQALERDERVRRNNLPKPGTAPTAKRPVLVPSFPFQPNVSGRLGGYPGSPGVRPFSASPHRPQSPGRSPGGLGATIGRAIAGGGAAGDGELTPTELLRMRCEDAAATLDMPHLEQGDLEKAQKDLIAATQEVGSQARSPGVATVLAEAFAALSRLSLLIPSFSERPPPRADEPGPSTPGGPGPSTGDAASPAAVPVSAAKPGPDAEAASDVPRVVPAGAFPTRALLDAERWLAEAFGLTGAAGDTGGDASLASAHGGIPGEAVLSTAVALQGLGRHSEAIAMLQQSLAHHVLHDEKSSLVAHAKLAKSALSIYLEASADVFAADAHVAADELTLIKEEFVVPRLRVLLPSGDPRIAEAAIVELLGDHHLFAEPPAGAGGGDDEGGERAPADVAADLRAEHARTLLEACAWDARLKALVGPLLFTALTEVAASAP